MRSLPLFLLLACSTPKEPVDSAVTETDTDADADADTDSDTDADTDSDTDTDTNPNWLQPGFEALLTDDIGCANVFMYSSRPADDVALRFTDFTSDYVGQAIAAGSQQVYVIALPDANAELQVLVGSNLTREWCNDIGYGTAVTNETWTAVSGTATLTVNPQVAYGANATLDLNNVELELVGGTDRITFSYTTASVFVGWYAG